MNRGGEASGAQRHAVARLAAAAAVAAALAVLTGCSAGSTVRLPSARPASRARGGHERAAPPTRTHATPCPSPSALPVAPPMPTQPAADHAPSRAPTTQAFGNAVHDIWLAVTTGDPDDALPAFFPEKAYEQVKAIGNPDADWQSRLWYDFTLDLAAAHKLVPRDATLVKVIVPASTRSGSAPAPATTASATGTCQGRASSTGRAESPARSASPRYLLARRLVLVHFGAVVRGGAYGIVDDPEPGPGVPGPPGLLARPLARPA